jgi:hypothetical protein
MSQQWRVLVMLGLAAGSCRSDVSLTSEQKQKEQQRREKRMARCELPLQDIISVLRKRMSLHEYFCKDGDGHKIPVLTINIGCHENDWCDVLNRDSVEGTASQLLPPCVQLFPPYTMRLNEEDAEYVLTKILSIEAKDCCNEHGGGIAQVVHLKSSYEDIGYTVNLYCVIRMERKVTRGYKYFGPTEEELNRGRARDELGRIMIRMRGSKVLATPA